MVYLSNSCPCDFNRPPRNVHTEKPSVLSKKKDVADQLLRLFISHSANIYGVKFIVYNVHSLCHLAAECLDHGPADSFSAYPYENRLGMIKHSLKSGYEPLVQAANHDLEKKDSVIVLDIENNDVVTVPRKHHVLDELIDGRQFKYLKWRNIELKCNRKDSCFITHGGTVVMVTNIVKRGEEIFLIGYPFEHYENL
ncbi:Putative transport protein ECA2683 [Frankliniella fusca]|uniref:Transport protein ECA2683 n=1 Tax=Frankliniella fusca TaxID=407009 RepID=A0AAE1I304_9NEOP|nr:Putative transport protein ECA2683 [Frankliniella fusca]